MRVYGLKEIKNNKYSDLKLKTENKSTPEKWAWKPYDPEKIRNISETLAKEKKAIEYACMTNCMQGYKDGIVLIFRMGNLTYGFIKHLEENNIKFVYIDFCQFVAKGVVKINYTKKKFKSFLQIDDITIDLDAVRVVIWNTPFFPKPIYDHEMLPEKGQRNKFLHRKRWAQVLKELKGHLNKDVLWVPGDPLSGSQDWQNKISEYKIALEEGLHIPPFILTNDKMALKEFHESTPGDLLFREFSTPPFSFAPIKVKLEQINSNLLKTSPCFFQKYISKAHEYRVVMFMDKVFPCKIYSQDSELTKDDWRVHDDEKVKWELTKLPTGIEKKLINIRERLGISWCSIDLICSPDNEYYFLEANRPGAHYWLDMFVGLDITKEIVKTIMEKKYIKSF